MKLKEITERLKRLGIPRDCLFSILQEVEINKAEIKGMSVTEDHDKQSVDRIVAMFHQSDVLFKELFEKVSSIDELHTRVHVLEDRVKKLEEPPLQDGICPACDNLLLVSDYDDNGEPSGYYECECKNEKCQ